MSFFVTRPASPVPGIALRSRLCSAAIFRTSGVERRRSRSSALSPPFEPGSDARLGAGAGAEAAAGRDAGGRRGRRRRGGEPEAAA